MKNAHQQKNRHWLLVTGKTLRPQRAASNQSLSCTWAFLINLGCNALQLHRVPQQFI